MSTLVCSGCDTEVPSGELLPFSCPNRGVGDDDHVLRLVLSAEEVNSGWPAAPLDGEANPFVRYRKLSRGYHVAMDRGMSDSDYVSIAEDLSDAIARVDSQVRVTKRSYCDSLGTWIKNETDNVSGSHKSRHLIGTAIELEVAARLGTRELADSCLAIASCGNAALAAAVVAKAAGRSLKVFVPPSADGSTMTKLAALGAERIVCERETDGPPGDPCYLQFRQAVTEGAIPFSCQGGDNALAILGGHTLGWEIIEQEMSDKSPADRIFIQVGGGALASSILQAFTMARNANMIDSLPIFHAVQTQNAHPMARAWQYFQAGEESLSEARHHRSQYMWPWEEPPQSIAGGILDDETYDWFSILEGLEASSGTVLTVSEETLREAQARGSRESGIAVDPTGTAGLAGLLHWRNSGQSREERTLVLFTGAIR